MTKDLLRSGIAAMGVKLLAAGFSYAMFVVLARWLGTETYGRYAAAFSAGTFLSFIILSGLNSEVLRRLPLLHDDADSGAVRSSFLSTVVRAQALMLLAVSAAGMLLAIVGIALNKALWAEMIVLALAFGAALALAELLASIFRALGAVNIALVPRDLLWRLLVVVTVVGLIAFDIAPSLTFAAVLSISLLLLALICQTAIGRNLLPSRRDKLIPPETETARGLLWRARWMMIASVASNLLQPLGVVVVGAVLSYEDSGLFFAAQRTAALLSLPLIAMNMIGAPRIALAWGRGDSIAVQQICTQISVAASAGAVLGLLLTLGFAGKLLGIFNPTYSSAGSVLVILALSNVVNTLAGATGSLMMMSGHAKQLVVLSAIGQGGGIFLVFLGGRFGGIHGAAVGELIGVLIVNTTITIWSLRRLNIDPSILSVVRKK